MDLFGGDSDEEGDLFAVPPPGAPPAHKEEKAVKKSEEKPKKKVRNSELTVIYRSKLTGFSRCPPKRPDTAPKISLVESLKKCVKNL